MYSVSLCLTPLSGLASLVYWPRTGDQYVDEPAGALLPAGYSGGVKDPHERSDEIVWIGVCAQFAASDSARDQCDKGSVNKTARPFDQSHRAARDGVHSRDDEALGSNMVNKEKHPGTQRFKRRHGGREPLFGRGKLFNFAAVNGLDEGVARWEVPIEGTGTDAGPARDIVEARRRAIAGERFLRYLKDAGAVALRVGAWFAGWRGWRGWQKLLFRHANSR